MITAKRSLWLLAAALLLVLAVACGSDDPPADGDRSGIPTLETLPPQPTPTPLTEINCPVDIPAVSLHSADVDQQAVVIVSEWTGEDCSFFGGGFTYIPAEAVQVAAGEPVTLILGEEPLSLSALVWTPDLSSAELISSGELAVPMRSANVGLRSAIVPLALSVQSEQPLPIAQLDPGDYIIEITGIWPLGRATLALRVAIS